MDALGKQMPWVRSTSHPTSRPPLPPVARTEIHTATLSAMSTPEVIEASVGRRPPYAVRPDRVAFDPSLTHSGHWKPTDASRMQSGQIGRSHRWQRIQVSLPGCR